MALPTNVNYGTVVGQFLLAYADSNDVGPEPDGVAAKGSIYFRPSPIKILDSTSTPNPVTILPAVVEATLDSQGYLCGYGTTRGINLVATNDADLQPLNWTWTAEFRLTDQTDTPVAIPAFSFQLPSGTTVDLAVVSPVPDSNGTYYLTGPKGDKGDTGTAATVSVGTTTTGAAGSSASVTNSGTSGAAVLDFTVPRGDTGATGPANSLSIGTVVSGTPAAATITGTAPSQTLNLTLPAGNASGARFSYSNNTTVTTVSSGYFRLSSTNLSGNLTFAIASTDLYANSLAAWITSWDDSTSSVKGYITITNNTSSNQVTFQIVSVASAITNGYSFSVTNFSGDTSLTNGGEYSVQFTRVGDKGDTGSLGALSANSPITYSSNTIGLDYNALVIDGGNA